MTRPWRLLRASLVPAAALAALIAVAPAAAGDPTGREIMERVDKDHRAKDERAEVDMAIMAKGQQPRRRKVVIFTQAATGDDDNTVIRFIAPADVKGTALLTLESGDDDTQYVYVPAIRKERRIASTSKTERFAGTDFTYEDLRTEQLDQYDYTVEKSEKVDGDDCWKIKAVPRTEKKREETGYDHRFIWVRKDHHLAIRVEYYDKQSRHHKTLRQLDWKEVEPAGGGKKVYRFHKADMQDHLRDSRTLMQYGAREIAPGLDDRIFTKGELGNP